MTANSGIRLRRILWTLALCATAPAVQAAGSIYKCEVGGVTTYADRPCSSQAEVHEVDIAAMNTYQTAAAGPTRATPARAKRAARQPTDPSLLKRQEMCARAARSLKEIANKMRSGYSAKEGERLRERQVKLRDQRRDSRCR